MQPRATSSKRLRQNVLPRLRRYILRGSLPPGSRIIESRLATALRISRTPLREALLCLEQEGLVRSDLRRGFSVSGLSAREVRETYPLLVALECHAARTNFQFLHLLLPELQRVNERFARARSPKLAMDLDARWHAVLMSQSRNTRLQAMIADLRLALWRYEYRYMSDVNLIATSASQHRAIMNAIVKRNLPTLLSGIEVNYEFGMQILLREMGES